MYKVVSLNPAENITGSPQRIVTGVPRLRREGCMASQWPLHPRLGCRALALTAGRLRPLSIVRQQGRQRLPKPIGEKQLGR